MWKLLTVVLQDNKIIGYDMISDKNERRTVTPQELYNAICNNAVVNAVIQNGKLIINGEYTTRVAEKTVNIPFTKSELLAIKPYLNNIYKSAQKKQDSCVLSALSHFSQALLIFGE